MAPEPTEAMVEAGALVRKTSSHLGPLENEVRKELVAAFAAAPPEWLLKAAFYNLVLDPEELRAYHLLVSRALRGGEET